MMLSHTHLNKYINNSIYSLLDADDYQMVNNQYPSLLTKNLNV